MSTTIGTVSSGTLNPEHLIAAFLDCLETLDKTKHAELLEEYEGFSEVCEDKEEEAEAVKFFLDESLIPALEEHALPYFYFGALPDDGADFGFWLDHQAIDDDVHDGNLLKVGDLSEVPNDYEGSVLVVNDHGNTSLYAPKSVLAEVWSDV